MEKAEELMLNDNYEVQSRDVLELSAESGCSAYDCEYIASAKNFGIKLITTDKQLIKAFPDIVVEL